MICTCGAAVWSGWYDVSVTAPAKNPKQNKNFFLLHLAGWSPRFIGGSFCVSLRIGLALKKPVCNSQRYLRFLLLILDFYIHPITILCSRVKWCGFCCSSVSGQKKNRHQINKNHSFLPLCVGTMFDRLVFINPVFFPSFS